MVVSPIYKFPVTKPYVAIAKYNKMVIARKIRLACFVAVPRLVKTFHNKPVIK